MIEAKIIQKYKDKSDSQLKQIAQRYFNAYIRKRDALNDSGDFKCISCGEIKSKEHIQAGHFYSVGNHSSVRFDVDNCHSECRYCNYYNHDHLIGYQKNLIKKIGVERFERLEQLANLKGFKFNRYMLIEIIERFKKL